MTRQVHTQQVGDLFLCHFRQDMYVLPFAGGVVGVSLSAPAAPPFSPSRESRDVRLHRVRVFTPSVGASDVRFLRTTASRLASTFSFIALDLVRQRVSGLTSSVVSHPRVSSGGIKALRRTPRAAWSVRPLFGVVGSCPVVLIGAVRRILKGCAIHRPRPTERLAREGRGIAAIYLCSPPCMGGSK